MLECFWNVLACLGMFLNVLACVGMSLNVLRFRMYCNVLEYLGMSWNDLECLGRNVSVCLGIRVYHFLYLQHCVTLLNVFCNFACCCCFCVQSQRLASNSCPNSHFHILNHDSSAFWVKTTRWRRQFRNSDKYCLSCMFSLLGCWALLLGLGRYWLPSGSVRQLVRLDESTRQRRTC